MTTSRKSAIWVGALLLLLLGGCTAPVVEKYTPFQTKEFSSRDKQPELFDGDVTELMQQGYLLIGYSDFTHNLQACYENHTCETISRNTMTMDELMKSSARRGADRVQVLYSSLEVVPRVLSVCTAYSTSAYVDKDGKVHTTTVCVSTAQYKGHMESWKKRALLWRLEPALASADNNYKAVQKAYAIINEEEPKQDPSPGPAKEVPATANPVTEDADVAEDLYGAQLVTAIENANYDFLAAQLTTATLQEWQKAHSLDPLMLAFRMQKQPVYRWLIEQPVAWTTETRNGYSDLEFAIAFGEPPDVEALLRKQSVFSARLRRPEIYYALAASQSPEMLDYMLSKGASVDGRAENYSLLYLAITSDNDALTARLLEKKAKLEPENGKGPSALMGAVLKGNRSMTARLLDAGARVGYKDDLGNTALHHAMLSGDTDTVKLLIERGAKPNVFNKKKLSPFYLALLTGKWDAAELLMQQRLDYSSPDTDAFVNGMRGLLYFAPPSTLDTYLKKTGLIQARELEDVTSTILVACAENCDEAKMGVFFDNGVNVHYAPKGKTLFRYAYEKKNVGAMVAMLKHGYIDKESQPLTNLQRALIVGDATLVKAFRLAASKEEFAKAEEKGTPPN